MPNGISRAWTPEWHLPSVDYVRWVGLADVCTTKCVLYRAEPNFILQGCMRAVIAPNNQSHERPKGTPMERGHVAWAGGSSGPDFFITMAKVSGFGGTHTVWGEVADDASMQLAERLVQRPIEAKHKAGTMRMLADPIGFTVHAETQGAR